MENQVPVLLIVFNRPQKTEKVITALRKIQPARLFVAADGPRLDHPDDTKKCLLAREAATSIDWPCEVQTRFLESNVGCEPSVSSAIEWFFEHVEHGIILEDDCVPHPDFFPFCSELFKRYADDERILQISGLAPYSERTHPHDYHFSRAFRCSGGWGTWRRAWKYFSFDMTQYNEHEAYEMLKAYASDRAMLQSLLSKFDDFKSGLYNNWDFLWNLACFAQNGLCVVPEKNLITNIGFDEEATHTRTLESAFANLRTSSLQFPLRHPSFVYGDDRPEKTLANEIYRGLNLKSRLAWRIRVLRGILMDLTKQ